MGKTSKEAAKGAATATQEAMKNAVDVSKDAAGVVVRLPNTRLIEMRERCDKAVAHPLFADEARSQHDACVKEKNGSDDSSAND